MLDYRTEADLQMKTIFAVAAALALSGVLTGCATAGTHAPHGQTQGSFPAIQNQASLVIALERTPCFGFCPDYRVEVHGDGTVVYDGRNFVDMKGRQTAHISAANVQRLVEAFRRADFFTLRDEYSGSVTDLPTHRISIAFDGRSKTITDYAGRMAGMPEAVSKLEMLVDEIAGTQQWIGKGGHS